MRVHLCLGQESPQAPCPSLCSHLRTPRLLEWWQLGHLWRALSNAVQNSAQFGCWHFLPNKNPEPNNLQTTLVVRGLCIFLFSSYWSVARTVDLRHFTSNVKPQKELVGYVLAKWKKINMTDFLWLSSSAMCTFPPLVPFPVHDAIQAITSFIWTVGECASSFSSCMSHMTLPIFWKAGLKGGWELLPGLRALVLESPCPVVCITRQYGPWHPGQMSKTNYQLLTPGTADLSKMNKFITVFS